MPEKLCEYEEEDGELEWVIWDRNESIQIQEYFKDCDTPNWAELLPKELIKKIYESMGDSDE